MTILQALKKHGPWLSSNELVKLTGEDKADLREELKALLEKGKIQRIGKAKGTKYGTLKAKPPEPVDFQAKILEALQGGQQLSWQQLIETAGYSHDSLKPAIVELIDAGKVDTNGKRKGVLFKLGSGKPKAASKPEPRPEPTPEPEAAANRVVVPADPDPYLGLQEERPWKKDPTPWIDSLLRKATREELYALAYAVDMTMDMDKRGGKRLINHRILIRQDRLDKQIRYVNPDVDGEVDEAS